MYYLREERLVSLDVLKLYCGEDVIRQNPDDIDPDQWLDEGELTELPEIPKLEAVAEPIAVPRAKKPDIEKHELPESKEELACRKGVNERSRVELLHETKEAELVAEENVEAPLQWNEVLDFMSEDYMEEEIVEGESKHNRDEVPQGLRKQRREDNSRAETFHLSKDTKENWMDSYWKNGMRKNRNKMNGKSLTSGRESLR